MHRYPEVLIAGAGIGGLTAALALHEHGVNSLVLERAAPLRALGLGINLLPHAVAELDRLGLAQDLSRIAAAPSAICYYRPDGTLLFREPRGIEGGYGWPQYSVHRGELQMLLLGAVGARLTDNAVQTGVEVTGFTQGAEVVTAHTTTGDVSSDFLIGADGIHSTLRAQLHPGADPLLWSGVRLVRGATPGEPFLDGHTMVIVKADDGVELVAYPIGGGLINWILKLPEGPAGLLPLDADWDQPGNRSEAMAGVDDWRLGWLDVADLIGRTETVLGYPMVDKAHLPSWGSGLVTLLGDAAHPMYPVGANGASQSILDARVLAEELITAGEPGLRAYEKQRRAETAEVVTANRDIYSVEIAPRAIAEATATYRRRTRADQNTR
jgi:2-polyprenyl-6-methoxyphenol hydroxylase-like FAD-dependent oxidoreductase